MLRNMARIFHVTYFDLFGTGNGVFYTDDSPVLGKRRTQHSTLEEALKPAKTCGRDDFKIRIHNFKDEMEAEARRRLRMYPNAGIEPQ